MDVLVTHTLYSTVIDMTMVPVLEWWVEWSQMCTSGSTHSPIQIRNTAMTTANRIDWPTWRWSESTSAPGRKEITPQTTGMGWTSGHQRYGRSTVPSDAIWIDVSCQSTSRIQMRPWRVPLCPIWTGTQILCDCRCNHPMTGPFGECNIKIDCLVQEPVAAATKSPGGLVLLPDPEVTARRGSYSVVLSQFQRALRVTAVREHTQLILWQLHYIKPTATGTGAYAVVHTWTPTERTNSYKASGWDWFCTAMYTCGQYFAWAIFYNHNGYLGGAWEQHG